MLIRLFLVFVVPLMLVSFRPPARRVDSVPLNDFRGTDTLVVVKRVTGQSNDTFLVVVKAVGARYEGRDSVTRTVRLHGKFEEQYDDFNLLPDGDIEEFQPPLTFAHGEDTAYVRSNWIRFPTGTRKQVVTYLEVMTTRNSTLYLADTTTYLGIDTVTIYGKRYPTIKLQYFGDVLIDQGIATVRSTYWYSPEYRAFLSQISLFDWGGIDYEVIRVLP